MHYILFLCYTCTPAAQASSMYIKYVPRAGGGIDKWVTIYIYTVNSTYTTHLTSFLPLRSSATACTCYTCTILSCVLSPRVVTPATARYHRHHRHHLGKTFLFRTHLAHFPRKFKYIGVYIYITIRKPRRTALPI